MSILIESENKLTLVGMKSNIKMKWKSVNLFHEKMVDLLCPIFIGFFLAC